MAELKPCPFCGGKAKRVIFKDKKTDDVWHGVRCSNCNCVGFYIDPQYETEATAIVKWNRRADDGK
jgi:Lar family restriction alleviation protein